MMPMLHSATRFASGVQVTTIRIPAILASMSSHRSRRAITAVLGQPVVRRVALTHAIDDAADALVTLSLVGSLFFSVSLDASRGRILLYLILTAAPLALVAPVVGPALDRLGVGYRWLIAASQLTRAVLALLLSASLLSLALYPLVFGILLSRKAYSLGKTALVAHLVPERGGLMAASGHLARTGTIAGGVGTALGGVLIATVGTPWLPVAAAVGYVIAAMVSLRIRATGARPTIAEAVVRAETPAEVRLAMGAVAVLHAAAGALTFLVAFAIKRGGGDAWIFAGALIAAGLGSFAGTYLASRLHHSMSPQRVVLLTLIGPGLVCAFGVATVGNSSVIVIATAIGVGGSIATREMDALYGTVPPLVRGRAISRSELVFQLANVLGAALAVSLLPGPRLGFAAVALALLVAGSVYASQVRLSIRGEAGRWLLRAGGSVDEPVEPLPRTLVDEAVRCVERNEFRAGVIVADSAIRVLEAQIGRVAQQQRAPWTALEPFVQSVVTGEVRPGAAAAMAAIETADRIVGSSLGKLSPAATPRESP
jgi:predicted MFS family arabinose efflux permease